MVLSTWSAGKCGYVWFQILVGMIILSLMGLLAGVESFLPISPSFLETTPRSTSHFHSRVQRHQQQYHGHRKHTSSVILNASENETNTGSGVLESVGLASQPIVWVSLYSLATTGHGLPAGPGGSIGAVEGLAYLVVVVLALLPTNKDSSSLSRTLSRASIALGLLVLAGVAAGKGCVPNAKPILDYSAYLPVCGPE